MARLPSLWQQPLPPSGAEVTPQRRMAWIREQVRLYARELALEQLLEPPPDDRLKAEIFSAVVDFGLKAKSTRDEIISAFDAEWDDATKHAARWLEALRRRVWSMCRAQMPEQTIIQAARETERNFSVFVGDELLMPLLKRIWDAAQPRRGKGPIRHGRAA